MPQEITTDEDPKQGQIVIDDNTGEAEIVDIEDEELPLAPARPGYWALVNLLLVLATVFALCLIIVEYFLTRKKKETDEEPESEAYDRDDQKEDESSDKRISLKVVLLGLIPAIGSVIAFLLTEDMTNSMRMVDWWTILMVVIFALEVLLLIFGRRRKEQEESVAEDDKNS
ncbi:MAG: hypothetical protein E7233_02220 [Lachnospiraceae bacterium]|nr:hypothetical protein [Lachnospiraceae bacterium]